MKAKLCSKCALEKPLFDFRYMKKANCYMTYCLICEKEYKAEWYSKNKLSRQEKAKSYYEEKKDEITEKSKNYRKKNLDKVKKAQKIFYLNNKKKVINRNNLNNKKRKKEDPLFRLKCNIRNSVNSGFRKNKITKKTKTEIILGCSFNEFKQYLESKFEPWMNWDNYGKYNGEEEYGWDIDHVIPISIAKSEEDIIKLNNYTNLQPLCSKINRDIKKDFF